MPKIAVDAKEFNLLRNSRSIIIFGDHTFDASTQHLIIQAAEDGVPHDQYISLEGCRQPRHCRIAELDLDDLHNSGWTEKYSEKYIANIEQINQKLVDEITTQSYDVDASEEHAALLLKWILDGRKTDGFDTRITVIDYDTCRSIPKNQVPGLLASEQNAAQQGTFRF